MSSFLDLCTGLAEKNFETGQVLIEAGTRTGLLYILIQGGVEIVKDDHVIGSINVPGSVFGEISFLLNLPHTATVRAHMPSKFYVTSDPQELFKTHPLAYYHISVSLAQRIRSLNEYLVEFKTQTTEEEQSPELAALVEVILHRTA